ncbi:hypothetical protein H257_01461 [Aphanomyces astaci]|uniref:Uncharacterized protein n=1 Tax=Aphanomyces astaci TaxID=112090 RepID=W4H976_APHAT|nr:hypothetical protein H257_01461 [Aphanomyces astaci]ETV88106.1 hypothetical protein H257_01461 [Aphanomyces astaci]|eukprot:XP_009822969.1 hypothetical protein H257_01461 [Aphanomyces astaci]
MVPPILPTRPSMEKRTSSPSLKSLRDQSGDFKQGTLPRLSSPRVDDNATDGPSGDEEAHRIQGSELQHCESILSTIQKETTSNGSRYITMLEFKETSNPALDSMHHFMKSTRKELGDLELLCANGWDNDDIDAILATIPRDQVATAQHLWTDSH